MDKKSNLDHRCQCGIGRSLALKFAKEGWLVATSSRRENLLSELCNLNKNIYSFPLDVGWKSV